MYDFRFRQALINPTGGAALSRRHSTRGTIKNRLTKNDSQQCGLNQIILTKYLEEIDKISKKNRNEYTTLTPRWMQEVRLNLDEAPGEVIAGGQIWRPGGLMRQVTN